MRFVIVTGMSGAGKSTALRTMEDLGYFCVDNLPVLLIEKFAEIVRDPNFKYDKVAVGIDIRSGKKLDDLSLMLLNLKNDNFTYEILFLDANDAELVKRFKETRRDHPLARGGRVEDGIAEERGRIAFLKEFANYIVDTTGLLTRELKREVKKILAKGKEYSNMIISIVSFGFKNGIPRDADMVFDVRFLPNPYYVEELKNHTGEEEAVRNYVMASGEGEEFLNKISDMMEYLVPRFVENEGKNQLVVAVGCTGGRHRSVTIANLLYERLQKLPYSVRVFHRDIGMDTVIKGE
ncbi:MAG: RNase adapter RapZ [Eubacterium sp.]|nr:RNase adapter RapZ [Eubacterium sp.]